MATKREIDFIKGTLSVNHATNEEIVIFLDYVSQLESLLDQGDMEDFYGTEGWKHSIGVE